MAIEFHCPFDECNAKLRIGTRKAGKVTVCPRCKRELLVPHKEMNSGPVIGVLTEVQSASPSSAELSPEEPLSEPLIPPPVAPVSPPEPLLEFDSSEEDDPLLDTVEEMPRGSKWWTDVEHPEEEAPPPPLPARVRSFDVSEPERRRNQQIIWLVVWTVAFLPAALLGRWVMYRTPAPESLPELVKYLQDQDALSRSTIIEAANAEDIQRHGLRSVAFTGMDTPRFVVIFEFTDEADTKSFEDSVLGRTYSDGTVPPVTWDRFVILARDARDAERIEDCLP